MSGDRIIVSRTSCAAVAKCVAYSTAQNGRDPPDPRQMECGVLASLVGGFFARLQTSRCWLESETFVFFELQTRIFDLLFLIISTQESTMERLRLSRGQISR